MQNLFKFSLLTLCFGSLCLLILNLQIKPYNFRHKSSKVAPTDYYHEIKHKKHESQTRVQNELLAKSYSNVEEQFERRKRRVQYLCTTIENKIPSKALKNILSKIVIDPMHGLTWCPIYKSASSMWMKNFAVLSGYSSTESLHSKHDKKLDFNYIVNQKFQKTDSVEEKLMQISKTKKFIIVRHPFERLLSAYRDKLEHIKGRNYYYKRYGQYITHRYRAKQSNLTIREPSFTEFLQFIAKEKRFDEHWVPFTESCQPCSINYDYIFKFETLSKEYNYFIKEYNLHYYLNYSSNKQKNINFHGTDDTIAETYFAKVPAALLLNIFKIYMLDFLLFSYSPAKYYFMTSDANQEIYSYLINK